MSRMLIMNEMSILPFMVVVIVFTALLSSVVTSALPYVPKWFRTFKYVIRRKLSRKPKPAIDGTAVVILSTRIDDLEEQMNNLAKNHYRRETNRKNNVRREVRDYLKELQNE